MQSVYQQASKTLGYLSIYVIDKLGKIPPKQISEAEVSSMNPSLDLTLTNSDKGLPLEMPVSFTH